MANIYGKDVIPGVYSDSFETIIVVHNEEDEGGTCNIVWSWLRTRVRTRVTNPPRWYHLRTSKHDLFLDGKWQLTKPLGITGDQWTD